MSYARCKQIANKELFSVFIGARKPRAWWLCFAALCHDSLLHSSAFSFRDVRPPCHTIA